MKKIQWKAAPVPPITKMVGIIRPQAAPEDQVLQVADGDQALAAVQEEEVQEEVQGAVQEEEVQEEEVQAAAQEEEEEETIGMRQLSTPGIIFGCLKDNMPFLNFKRIGCTSGRCVHPKSKETGN